MNEAFIKESLRSDATVRDLIAARAHQIYLSRSSDSATAEANWYKAENEVVEELYNLLIEVQEQAWRESGEKDSEAQQSRSFVTLVGFMLAKGGVPSRAELVDTRYYTIGLSYLTGIFQIGQSLEEESFIQRFSNDPSILAALLYSIRTNPASPYFTQDRSSDLRVAFGSDEELKKYLAYAETEARSSYKLCRAILLGKSS